MMRQVAFFLILLATFTSLNNNLFSQKPKDTKKEKELKKKWKQRAIYYYNNPEYLKMMAENYFLRSKTWRELEANPEFKTKLGDRYARLTPEERALERERLRIAEENLSKYIQKSSLLTWKERAMYYYNNPLELKSLVDTYQDYGKRLGRLDPDLLKKKNTPPTTADSLLAPAENTTTEQLADLEKKLEYYISSQRALTRQVEQTFAQVNELKAKENRLRNEIHKLTMENEILRSDRDSLEANIKRLKQDLSLAYSSVDYQKKNLQPKIDSLKKVVEYYYESYTNLTLVYHDFVLKDKEYKKSIAGILQEKENYEREKQRCAVATEKAKSVNEKQQIIIANLQLELEALDFDKHVALYKVDSLLEEITFLKKQIQKLNSQAKAEPLDKSTLPSPSLLAENQRLRYVVDSLNQKIKTVELDHKQTAQKLVQSQNALKKLELEVAQGLIADTSQKKWAEQFNRRAKLLEENLKNAQQQTEVAEKERLKFQEQVLEADKKRQLEKARADTAEKKLAQEKEKNLNLKNYLKKQQSILDSLKVQLLTSKPIKPIPSDALTSQQETYALQIFSGNPQDAQAAKAMFATHYPNMFVYQVYEKPYFKIRAGSFKSIREANLALKEVKKHFDGAFIVPSKPQ